MTGGWKFYEPQQHLQFASGPTTSARGRRVVGRGDGDDIANTQLYLQVAIAGAVVAREKHEGVVGDDVGFVGVA
jgi:hypothetical protein